MALAAIVGGALLAPTAYARISPEQPTWSTVGPGGDTEPGPPTPAGPPPPPTPRSGPVSVSVDGFFGWALLDRESGRISGENVNATSSTESMVKIWIVSDYLRRLGDRKPPAGRLEQASTAIRDSDDNAAQSLFLAGGGRPVIERLVSVCHLTRTEPVVPPGASKVWWSYTRISAADAVRMGECVGNGTAAGPRWTDWVLTEMTRVRGSTAAADQHASRGGGRWGIIDGLPDEPTGRRPVAVKNGWTMINADQMWHVNCLAVADDWVLAVLLRYPRERGLDHGARICAEVAGQLFTEPTRR